MLQLITVSIVKFRELQTKIEEKFLNNFLIVTTTGIEQSICYFVVDQQFSL